MQVINTEHSRSLDAMLVQMGAQQKPAAKEGNAFKDAVKKAFGEKNDKAPLENAGQTAGTAQNAAQPEQVRPTDKPQAANQNEKPDDDQLGKLAAMMAEANMTVLPFVVIPQPQVGQQAPQTQFIQQTQAPQTQQAAQTNQAPQMPQVEATAPVIELVPAENQKQQAQQRAGNTGIAVPKEVLAAPQAQANVTAQQTAQQTSNTAGARTETMNQAQQPQTEKPAAKGPEVTVRYAEVKPEAPKEAKQEHVAQTKPQIPLDPEKIHVKVGEGGKLNSEKLASDLSEKLLTRMTAGPQGTQQFTIELMPQDLGKILIKLVIMNGRAEIMMQCANPKTQQLVMANADIIRNIIEERTGLTTTVNAKDETEAYKEFNEKDGQNKQSGDEGQNDKKWAEAETDIFLQQLRLGLTETQQT
jgi:hypothetical protein